MSSAYRVVLAVTTLLTFTPSAVRPQERGWVALEATYTGDLAAVTHGGLERRVVYLDNLDLTLTVDLALALGLDATTLFLYGLGNQGGDPSRYVGDAQGVNNIEAPNSWRLYEAWVEHRVPRARLALLAGLYDLNAEFAFLRTAQLFLHSSHGIGAEFGLSGRNGPSVFPVTSLGARLRWLPLSNVSVQGVVLDGVPGDPAAPRGTHVVFGSGDGALIVVEVGYLVGFDDAGPPGRRRRGRRRLASRAGIGGHTTKLALGAWRYTGRLEAIEAGAAPTSRSGSHGAYVLAETEPTPGLALFARLGLADGAVNRFTAYTGGGAVWQGPIPARRQDRVGVALAVAHNGEPYRNAIERAGGSATARESVIELTYLARLIESLSAQGDLQYVMDPNTDPAVPDAWIATMRIQLSF